MNYYFAPMESITGYIYRNIYEKHFGGIQKYFSPFITTNQHYGMQNREKRDVLPENNQSIFLVPQILTNHADQFVDMAQKMQNLGYREVNLNLGCPSRTVVTKGKGSGFLADPDALDRFFAKIFDANLEVGISVKTRIGMEDPKEFEKILKIYDKYPFLELIIHPRLQTDFYKNHPNMEAFGMAVDTIKVPLCYNGDIYTKEDIENFREKYPTVNNLMLGRGLLRTPSLLKEVNGEVRDYNQWYDFLTELCETYEREFSGQKNVLYKMKEHWYYLFQSLPEDEKAVKAMKKTKDLGDYRLLVKSILKG